MVSIGDEQLTPASIWIQVASLCFFLAAIFGDVFIIRFWLFMAYIFVFVNSFLGSPSWPNIDNPGKLKH